MFVNAKLRNLRIAPRKVRLVVDLIRGKSVEKAQTILNFTVKEAARPVLKLLKGAMANAKNNFQIEESNLYVSKITVDEGRKYKRWMPRARGKADQLQKKTSHINIVLNEIKKEPKKTKKKLKAEIAGKVEKVESSENAAKVLPKFKKPKVIVREETPKPKVQKGIKKIFKRKSF